MTDPLNNKTLQHFLKDFFLSNAYWIVAVILLAGPFGWKTTLVVILAVVAFGYIEYKRYLDPRLLFVQQHRLSVDIFYYSAFWGFLGITFWSSYTGFLQVSGNSARTQHTIVFFILTLFLVAALACSAFIVKSRRSPKVVSLAVILFLFFDLAIALPFNWLFFFNVYKGTNQVARDKQLIDTAVTIADRAIRPRMDSITRASTVIINRLGTIEDSVANAVANRNQENALTLKQRTEQARSEGKELSEYDRRVYTRAVPVNLPKYYYRLKNAYESSALKNDSLFYGRNDSMLKHVTLLKNNLLTEKDSDKAEQLSLTIKSSLRTLAIDLKDSSLIRFTSELAYREPTPLELVINLQRFVFTGALSPAMEPFRPIVQVSLLTSIVIDILPLLLSFLYARYIRED